MSGIFNPNTSNNLFTQLGHFSLDDNTGSNYQSRELKTVYLDLVSQYFKVSFTKNYDNRLNKFNQIGIVKMQFVGQHIGEYEIGTLYPEHNSYNMPYSDPQPSDYQHE